MLLNHISHPFKSHFHLFHVVKRHSSCLIIGEHDNRSLRSVTAQALTAAKKLGVKDINILLLGTDCSAAATALSKCSGVSKLLIAQNDAFKGFLAETITNTVANLQKKHNYAYILAAATSFTKNILPRIASKLDVSPISEVVGIKSGDTFQRAIYAGNAICTLQSLDKIKVLLVRSTSFEKDNLQGGSPSTENVTEVAASDLSSFVRQINTVTDRPDLTTAKIVVSGGRGVGSKENFSLIYKLADKMKAAVGASRAAVDAGFVPNDLQIGQTGKIVAPDVYMAIGISGAIQHLAGMKDSKTIVAINKDKEAPIFQIATYGLVGDLVTIVPELTNKV